MPCLKLTCRPNERASAAIRRGSRGKSCKNWAASKFHNATQKSSIKLKGGRVIRLASEGPKLVTEGDGSLNKK